MERDFASLHELNEYMDDHCAEFAHMNAIGQLYQKVRDQLREAGDFLKERQAQVELCCFSFWLRDGKLEPMFSGLSEDNRPWSWPSLQHFEPDDLAFIEERLSQSTNPIVRARYAHVLYAATHHNRFATVAVENYLAAVPLHAVQDQAAPREQHGLRIAESLIAAAELSLSSRAPDLESIVDKMFKGVGSICPESSIRVNALLLVLNFIYDNRKKLPSPQLEDWLDLCVEEARAQFEQRDYHATIYFLELGQKLASVLGASDRDFEFQLGKCYDNLIDTREGDQLVQIAFCQDAIRHYERSKDSSRVPALQARLIELKGDARFGQVTQEIDLTDLVNQCAEFAEKLVSRGSESVIAYLMHTRQLLPRFDDLARAAEEQAVQFPLQSLAPSAIFDSEGNTIQHFTSEDERHYFHVLQNCHFWLETSTSILLRAIFFRAIQTNKLDTSSLATYLSTHSWLGKTLTRRIGNEVQPYNWLQLLIPGLDSYFEAVKFHLHDNIYRPSFVLAVDSLTTKIEGMIRDICRISRVPTTRVRTDRQGRTTTVERDIDDLLREQAVATLFDKDDLLFLRFLLVEHAGYALRHQVAHALMRPQDYTLRTIHYLILAVLRIGRYDFVYENPPEETNA